MIPEITNGAIQAILRIASLSEKETMIDANLQLLNMNEEKQLNSKTYILGDNEYSYGPFIFDSLLNKKEPKKGDIINISKFTSKAINHSIIIIIKDYDILKTNVESNNSLTKLKSYKSIQNIKNSTINPKDINIESITHFSEISTFSTKIKLYVKISRILPLKQFNKNNKEHSRLSFILKDTKNEEMSATIFDETIDKFYDILEEGKIYYILGGRPKIIDKNFAICDSNYTLTFDNNTEIKRVDEKFDTFFKKERVNNDIGKITKFSELNNCKKNETINCVGYILQIIGNNNSKIKYKRVIIGDTSMNKIQLTLWNKFADLNLKIGDFLLLQNIKIDNYNNCVCLSTKDNSIINRNQDIDTLNEIKELKTLINEKSQFKSISFNNEQKEPLWKNKIYYLSSLLAKIQNESNFNFTIKCTIYECQHTEKNYYVGCPNEICKKKLINKNRSYFCPSCKKTFDIDKIKIYYSVFLKVIDFTGRLGIYMFGDIVDKLFGVDANTYRYYVENNNSLKLKEISNNFQYHTFYFYGKVSDSQYQDKTQKKLYAYQFEEENFKVEKHKLINIIKNALE